MNREPNKEIDILLRKLSRKQNGKLAAESSSGGTAEDHLDADELNAYAEQALPAALRARYTEHVADCGRCRSIVTQLSLSSSAVISHNVVDQPAPSRVKTFIASLFSPLVVRYAIPAMAVIMVAAIAWIVVRRPAGTADVALNSETRQVAPVASSESAPVAEPSVETTDALNDNVIAKQKAENKQANAPREETPETTTATRAADELKESEPLAKRDEPAPPAAAPAAGVGAVAVAPKPVSETDKNTPADQKKIQSDLGRVQSSRQQEDRSFARAQKSGPAQPAKTPASEVETVKQNEAARVQRREREAMAEEKQKDEASDDRAETRSVAGHSFKRRGSVWIDVLYDSNRSTVNVSRGSEHYRSLVGDEPGLRTIAEQLSGEIIVVWKGRAYRIK
jgi:hypothetical protein